MEQETAPASPIYSPASAADLDNDWPLRPWLLAGLLGLAGLLVHFASHGGENSPWRMALTAFFCFAPIAAAFTINREFRKSQVIFSLCVGVVMAGIAWRATSAGDRYSDQAYWIASGVVAVTLAVPLFQAGFHRKHFSTSYSDTHYFVWTDLISGAGAFVFLGISWALIAILSQLFQLIQIDLLKKLLEQGWFGWAFSGVAFGAGLGTLRNQLKVLSTLQSVVLMVLSMLAVPLAVGLVIFLLAMIVSGPDVLWEATRRATPVLLACGVGAFILTNAVIRAQDPEMSSSRLLRIAALVLALCIFPLTLFASVSMGTRIAQYGLSPERIWALTAIAIATAYGFAYFLGVIRGRKAGWRDYLRRSNLHLAAVISVIGLVLAMPIFNFGAISARNQLARLESGTVSAKDFDYAALRWDFGEPGRAALAKLVKSPNEDIAKGAKIAQAQNVRFYRGVPEGEAESSKRLGNLRMDIEDPALRERIEFAITAREWNCSDPCFAIDTGISGPGEGAKGEHRIALVEGKQVVFLSIDPDAPLGSAKAGQNALSASESEEGDLPEDTPTLAKESKVEIRDWQGRKIFVDGKPIGRPFK